MSSPEQAPVGINVSTEGLVKQYNVLLALTTENMELRDLCGKQKDYIGKLEAFAQELQAKLVEVNDVGDATVAEGESQGNQKGRKDTAKENPTG